MIEQRQLIPLSPGELLRERREQKRITVAEAAKAIKVPVTVVESLESGDTNRFAPIYRKGYLRAYAALLELGEEETAEVLAAGENAEPVVRSVFTQPVRRPSSERWLRVASYLLASLLVGTLGWQLTHEAVRLTQGGDTKARADVANGKGAAESQAAPAHVSASIAALEGFQSPAPVGGQAAWNALRAQETPPSQSETTGGEHQLRLVTSGDSWVEISDASGAQLELDLVRGGGERQYSGRAPFRIVLGRAAAVELFMDGELVDTEPYTSGQVVQMTLEARPVGDATGEPQG